MIALPRTLQAWSEVLGLLDDEVQGLLGTWLDPLRTIVGPLRVSRAAPSGEPDGYDGLTRRGSYERLLASEWLLADEAPLEFLRRATTGEHLFKDLARIEPRGSKTSLALFDAGPAQLGAPRLAHIALLVVLARRARAAGAHFLFGVLQRPRAPEALSESSLHSLLHARTFEPARADMMTAWHTYLEPLEPIDDLWVVGGPELARWQLDSAVARLIIEESDVQPQLEVEARRSWASTSRTNLCLPDRASAAGVLRNPCSRQARVGLVARPLASMLLLLDGGRRLFIARKDGTYEGLHVPSSPREPRGRSRLIRQLPEKHFVALGLTHRNLLKVTMTSRLGAPPWLLLRGADNEFIASFQADRTFEVRDQVAPLWVTQAKTRPSQKKDRNQGRTVSSLTAWLQSGSTLWKLEHAPDTDSRATPFKHLSGSASMLPGRVLAWARTDDEDRVWIENSFGETHATAITASDLCGLRVGPRDGDGHAFAFAHAEDGRWRLHTPTWQHVFENSEGTSVLGIQMGWFEGHSEYRVWMLSKDRRNIRCRLTRSGPPIAIELPHPINKIDFDAENGIIAWMTDTEIGVHRNRGDTIELVLRLALDALTDLDSAEVVQ